MNFVGHIHLARIAVGDAGPGGVDPNQRRGRPADRGFLVGAALPDIAAMGRFRLAAPSTDRAVRGGIDLHHRTDDAFHRHPWFRRNAKAVTDELDRAGLTRGAARACGHVGVELLLDGRLLHDRSDLGPSVQWTIAELARPDLLLSDLVGPEHRPAWAAHLQAVSAWTLPDDYRLPAAVAERLQRILTRRPRLAFGPDQVATVAAVLTERQPILEADLEEMVTDLSETLAA